MVLSVFLPLSLSFSVTMTLLEPKAGWQKWWDGSQFQSTRVKGQEKRVQVKQVPSSRHPSLLPAEHTLPRSLEIVLLPQEFSYTMVGRLWRSFSTLF